MGASVADGSSCLEERPDIFCPASGPTFSGYSASLLESEGTRLLSLIFSNRNGGDDVNWSTGLVRQNLWRMSVDPHLQSVAVPGLQVGQAGSSRGHNLRGKHQARLPTWPIPTQARNFLPESVLRPRKDRSRPGYSPSRRLRLVSPAARSHYGHTTPLLFLHFFLPPLFPARSQVCLCPEAHVHLHHITHLRERKEPQDASQETGSRGEDSPGQAREQSEEWNRASRRCLAHGLEPQAHNTACVGRPRQRGKVDAVPGHHQVQSR